MFSSQSLGFDLIHHNEQFLPTYIPAQPHFPTAINHQQPPIIPSSQTAEMIQHDHVQLNHPTHPPLATSPHHLPSFSLPQFASQVNKPSYPRNPPMFQMEQMPSTVPRVQTDDLSLMHPPSYPPLAASKPVHGINPPPLLRPGMSANHMDFQPHVQPDHFPPHLYRRDFTHQSPITSQRPTSPQRLQNPYVSPQFHVNGESFTSQPPVTPVRAGIGLQKVQSRSPHQSPITTPRGSLRKGEGPPPDPRLYLRQQQHSSASPLPSSRAQSRQRRSQVRRSPSSPPSFLPRERAPLSVRAQSPHQTVQATPIDHPPSPSQSQNTRQPLPNHTSTHKFKGVSGSPSHVPMGSVKPSPANVHPRRRSRRRPPVTQHVAPFRSSIRSCRSPPSGQLNGVVEIPMLARKGKGLQSRDSKPQMGFQRPIGRGQPLVRMPRHQSSPPSFREPPPRPLVSRQPSFKQATSFSPQPFGNELHNGLQSPYPFQESSTIPLASPQSNGFYSHPSQRNRTKSPQNVGATSFHRPIPYPIPRPSTPSPSQSVKEFGHTASEPATSLFLTNSSQNHTPFPLYQLPSSLSYVTHHTPQRQQEFYPHSSAGEIVAEAQNGQEVTQNAPPGQSKYLMQGTHLHSSSYSSPLLPNANPDTTFLSQTHSSVPGPSSTSSPPCLSSAMHNTQLRNKSFTSPLQRHLSPMSHASTAQQTVRVNSSLLSGLQTSQIKGSMFKPTVDTLTTPPNPVETQFTIVDGVDGASGTNQSSPLLSNAMQKSNFHQASYQLPDGMIINQSEPAEYSPVQPHSSPVLSSALLNPHLQRGTYRLPSGMLGTSSEAKTTTIPASPMLSSAMLNPKVRKPIYKLPDGTTVLRTKPSSETVATSSPRLSSALVNVNALKSPYQLSTSSIKIQPRETMKNPESTSQILHLHEAQSQLPEGSSHKIQASTSMATGPVLSGALLNTSIRGATYRLPNPSLLRETAPTVAPGIDLSSALRNPNISRPTSRLPTNIVMAPHQSTSTQKTIDLSSALSKSTNIREANFHRSDNSIGPRLDTLGTPEPHSFDLSGALKNPVLQGASYRLPSSCAVVSPHVQYSVPEKHWAHGSEVKVVDLQQDMDVWGAESILPHGTVQNLNKWSVCGDENLIDHQHLMTQQNSPKTGVCNLNREGEPQGPWFDKVSTFDSPYTVNI
ncbi:mucin-6-like [Hippocampus comes]|uniref:mucin-6-like n=1 Tax=Hippocampus comes TaxID=109280 RepID=UPI00094E180C|nr:PREDICTED: mucin-6-like [Hippocampus comes]